MRQRVVRALRVLDPMSVENKVRPGTPDVECIAGWLELKWLRRWPQNAEASPVLIPHFTPQQRVWLRRRWIRGGAAYVLLKVSDEWLLFDGLTASQILGRATQPELRERAYRQWKPKLIDKELRECLPRS
jgi:hypothetical protein